MNLLKTSLVSVIGVLARLLSQLCINKILAYYLGPTGFALIGQYQSLMQIMLVLSTSTLNNGVVKKTAEDTNNKGSISTINVWRLSVTYSILCTLIVVLICVFYGGYIAEKYMGSNDYSTIPLYFSAAFLFFCFNNILISILNGYHKIELITLSNVLGSIISVVLTYVFVLNQGLIGALIALSIYQGVWFFATLYICRKYTWLKLSNFFGKTDLNSLKFLSNFVAMSVVTAICVPLAQIYIRTFIIDELSLQDAGYWESMQRLSLAYLTIATSVLSMYFLPKYSTINSKYEIIKEIKNGYFLIVPPLLFILVIAYLNRGFIISIIYSEEFNAVSNLLHFQLVGDFFKICSWILSYYLVAKALSKTFIILEVLFTLTYVLFTKLSILYLGIEHVAFGYAINYFLYFFVLFFLCFGKRGYINILGK